MKGRYNIRETREANSSTNECLTISHTKSLHETNIELIIDDSLPQTVSVWINFKFHSNRDVFSLLCYF